MLDIQGLSILDMVSKYDAPLYIYDSSKMESNYKQFVNAFDVPSLKVHYACKALSNISVK